MANSLADQPITRERAAAEHHVSPLAYAVLVAIFLAVAALFWRYTCDDAYITFRYVANAAAGHGLVFNPGGPAVEGFSNFLWLLLLLGGVKLGLPIIGLAKVLGLGFGLGALLLAYGTVVRLRQRDPAVEGGRSGKGSAKIGERALWVLLLLATNCGLAYFAVSGLETAMYAFVLLGIAYSTLLRGPARAWAVMAFAAAAALTRPEGLLIWALMAAWVIGVTIIERRQAGGQTDVATLPAVSRRSLPLPAVLVSALPVVAFLLWRHAYFGAWLPNTYYAKPPGAFGTASYLSGLTYLRDYLEAGGGVLWLALALVMIARPRLRAATAGFVLLFAAEAALVVHARGDWMALHRFLVPVTPLLVAFGFAGLLQVTSQKRVVLALVVLMTALNGVQIAQTVGKFSDGLYPYYVMSGNSQKMAGQWLKSHFPPQTVLACKRVGAISYYSGMRMVDALGLTDRTIAMIRHDSARRGQKEYAAMAQEVLRRRPDLVLLCLMARWAKLPPTRPVADFPTNLMDVDKPLYQGLLARGYRFVCRLPQGGAGELAIFSRPGFPVPGHLNPPTKSPR